MVDAGHRVYVESPVGRRTAKKVCPHIWVEWACQTVPKKKPSGDHRDHGQSTERRKQTSRGEKSGSMRPGGHCDPDRASIWGFTLESVLTLEDKSNHISLPLGIHSLCGGPSSLHSPPWLGSSIFQGAVSTEHGFNLRHLDNYPSSLAVPTQSFKHVHIPKTEGEVLYISRTQDNHDPRRHSP